MGKDRFKFTKLLLVVIAMIAVELFSVIHFGDNAWAKPVKKNTGEYGVFLGCDHDDIEKIRGFSTVVIDAWELSASDVEVLHNKGCRVYSYINPGSIENWRSYYEDYKDLAMGEYENWEDEQWVNVADASWQEFMTGTVAKKISENGADGFFVDNADVYYQYPTEEIYQGLCNIMSGIKAYGKPVLINGGDTFVTRLIDEGKADLITGVNQETVFTRIKDYKNDRFGRQKNAETKYFKKYLDRCSKDGLQVYLLEYTKKRGLAKKIRKYCEKRGYHYFAADSVALEWSESVLN